MPMNRWDRKAQMPHGSVTGIARQLGKSVGHVSQVLNDRRRAPDVEQEIAKVIGLPVEQVFPPRQQSAA